MVTKRYILREGVTGHAKVLTGRITRGVQFEYRKGPESNFIY
jgi:hypothetical protein